MPDHTIECEERARQVTELRRRLSWEQIQKNRLLDEVQILRDQVSDLQARVDEYEAGGEEE